MTLIFFLSLPGNNKVTYLTTPFINNTFAFSRPLELTVIDFEKVPVFAAL